MWGNTNQKKLCIWTLLMQCDLKKMSIRYSYLSVFSQNAGKYGPEKTPYLDTFHTVSNVHQCKEKGKDVWCRHFMYVTEFGES